MFVKETEGARVLRPHSKRRLPAEGAEVPDTDPYWIRRKEQGDIAIVDPPKDEPVEGKPVEAKE